MAFTFTREAIPAGDSGVWDAFEQPQNHCGGIGQLSCHLYDDSGTLKLSLGYIGLDNDSVKGVIYNSAAYTIAIAGISNSIWAKVEVSVTAGVVTVAIADISGATTAATLPTDFTNAWDGEKQGYYITATKRCIGVIWKNSGGNLDGVVNALPFIDGYCGLSEIDINIFLKHKTAINTWSIFFRETVATKSASETLTMPTRDTLYNCTAGTNGIRLTLPASAAVNIGRKLRFRKVDDTNSAATIVAPGTDTINGYTYIFLIDKWQEVEIMDNGDGTWSIIGGYLAADSGPISTNDESNRHFGTMDVVFDGAVGTMLIGETVKEATSNNTGILVKITATVATIWKCYSPGATPGVFTNDRIVTGLQSAATFVVNNGGTTKNTDCALYHGFGLELGLIEYKYLYSLDGTAWEEMKHFDDVSAGDVGICVQTNDTNNVIIQTGSSGIAQMNSAGATAVISAGDDFYRVRAICRF